MFSESSSGVLPENWTIQPDKENLKLVKLNPQNSEYQDVEKNFRSTLGRLAATVLSVRHHYAHSCQLHEYGTHACVCILCVPCVDSCSFTHWDDYFL